MRKVLHVGVVLVFAAAAVLVPVVVAQSPAPAEHKAADHDAAGGAVKAGEKPNLPFAGKSATITMVGGKVYRGALVEMVYTGSDVRPHKAYVLVIVQGANGAQYAMLAEDKIEGIDVPMK